MLATVEKHATSQVHHVQMQLILWETVEENKQDDYLSDEDNAIAAFYVALNSRDGIEFVSATHNLYRVFCDADLVVKTSIVPYLTTEELQWIASTLRGE